MLTRPFREVALGDLLCEVSRPVSVRPSDLCSLLGVRWYGRGCHIHRVGIGSDLKSPILYEVNTDDIVYNKMWTSKAAFGLVGEELRGAVATSEYPTFVVDTAMAVPKFIAYVLATNEFSRSAQSMSRGTTSRARLHPRDFLLLKVPFPSIAIQRKIVASLSAVDEAIEKTEVVLSRLQEAQKSIANELLAKGLPGAHQSFTDSEFEMMPSDWRLATLADIALPINGLQTGPFGSQLKAEEYVQDGVPVIMPKDINGLRVIEDGISRVPAKRAEELARHKVVHGDVLFARRGEIGRCALITRREEGWLCGTGCLRVRFGGAVVPEFIVNYLSWKPVVEWLMENAVGQTMLNLSTSILAEVPVRIPSIPEQLRIANILAAVAERTKLEGRVCDALRQLKDALLHSFLSGAIRVNPDESTS